MLNDEFVLKEDSMDSNDDFMYVIIDPNSNEEELNDSYNKYQALSILLQRRSDEKAMEKYGKDNKTIYDDKIKAFNKNDIDTSVTIVDKDVTTTLESEGFEDTKSPVLPKEYTNSDIDRAIDWSHASMIPIVYPCYDDDKLEDLWHAVQSTPKQQRRKSDWICIELFGLNNEELYNYCKSITIKSKQIIDAHEKEITPEDQLANTIISGADTPEEILDNIMDISKTESAVLESTDMDIISSIVDDNKEYFLNNICDISSIFPSDMPFFSPNELIDFKNSHMLDDIVSSNTDDEISSSKQWLESYKQLVQGNAESYNSSEWINTIRKLMMTRDIAMQESTQSEVDNLNKQILSYGWNPYIEFTNENRVAARERVMTLIKQKYENTNVVNLESFGKYRDECIDILFESAKKKNLIPIYIVLIEGTTAFSRSIKKFTNSFYSHAAICIDGNFEHLYSFNLNTDINRDGLSIESISKYPQDNHLGVFAIFVNQEDFDKIKAEIDYYEANRDKTHYNLIGVAGLPLGISSNSDMSMFCSQFVDHLLKFVNIDITNKKSGLVSPADFDNIGHNKKNIYVIYEGKCSEFSAKKANNMVEKISATAKYIKEAVELISRMGLPEYYKTILNPVLEVKTTPVVVTPDGDILINKHKKMNYELEYQEAHKLLMAYNKAGNIEGMKSELARLWFLNQFIEVKINKKESTDEYMKLRARVLNDFNKYLDIVCKSEGSFNFNEYYKTTPYSDATIKITNGTIKGTFKLIKDIIYSV